MEHRSQRKFVGTQAEVFAAVQEAVKSAAAQGKCELVETILGSPLVRFRIHGADVDSVLSVEGNTVRVSGERDSDHMFFEDLLASIKMEIDRS